MFDVLVIGAGHAGCEAATAAARRGARVGLLTFSRSDIGQMSCNPSIGGVGKGHLVREIDAMGGIMAKAADRSAIHHRMLNASKGSAVRGPRVQADRIRFQGAVGQLLAESGVIIIEGEAVELTMAGTRVSGVVLRDGSRLEARATVLATGTFLGATLFRGEERWPGGRLGGASSSALANQVGELGLANGRLKTGTPPRIDGRSVDWAVLEPQPSDTDPWTMSMDPAPRRLPQLSCAITRTTARTHDVIRTGLGRSPLFAGAIEGRGPRYCPSIEDKVVRFGDREGHQIFLEPEGLDSHLVYPNGISTSLPQDVQAALVRSIPGMSGAHIVQYGYAVEYAYADPRKLNPTLEHGDIDGLFFAGQLNGTTGYEEAGAQGLVAGANAAASALALSSFVPDRASSYMGVMIDDLTVQGVSEPYRMLTARSEYRLHLRADNAWTRLGPAAQESGLLSAQCARRMADYAESKTAAQLLLARLASGADLGLDSSERKPLADWARREDVADRVVEMIGHSQAAKEAFDDAVYAPYLERQKGEKLARSRDARVVIPASFDFDAVPGLSNEMRERLLISRPANLDQASRISGVTPAALSALHFALAKAAA